jgi:hypothetical protein
MKLQFLCFSIEAGRRLPTDALTFLHGQTGEWNGDRLAVDGRWEALARRNDPAVAGRDERLFSAFCEHQSCSSVSSHQT